MSNEDASEALRRAGFAAWHRPPGGVHKDRRGRYVANYRCYRHDRLSRFLQRWAPWLLRTPPGGGGHIHSVPIGEGK